MPSQTHDVCPCGADELLNNFSSNICVQFIGGDVCQARLVLVHVVLRSLHFLLRSQALTQLTSESDLTGFRSGLLISNASVGPGSRVCQTPVCISRGDAEYFLNCLAC